MTNNRFFVKLSNSKRGINLDLVTDWTMTSDGILFINFGGSTSDSGIAAVGEEAQRLLRLLNALSLDLDSFDQAQITAQTFREKWIQDKLEKAANGSKQEEQ